MSDELAKAAGEGNLPKLKYLIEGGKYEPKAKKAQDAVIAASMKKQLEAMRMLLEWGAPTDARDSNDNRALLVAASGGCTDIVKLMLEHKADPSEKDLKGQDSMQMAVAGPHFAIVKELIRAGAEAPENATVPGLGAAVFEARLDVMTKQMLAWSELKVDNAEILAVEDKVWTAMREHMRLLELREEQRSGEMLLRYDGQIGSAEEEARKSKEKAVEWSEELGQSRVLVEKERTEVRDLEADIRRIQDTEAVLVEEDQKLRTEIKERQAELLAAQKSRDTALAAKSAREGENAEWSAEIEVLEEEVKNSSLRKTELASELEAAQIELSGWLKDKEAAAELSAQAHRLLGT